MNKYREVPRYVLVSPVRNEEKYLARTINSVINQTILPTEYIFVDDGSNDRTPDMIQAAAKEYPWIRYVRRADRGARKVGPGVVEAFYDGYVEISTDDYEFIGKIDGDISFGPRYFETLFEKFEEDTFLGAASGKIFLELDDGTIVEERHADEMVVGAMQFYKRECFEAIGGFVREVMWDGIAIHRCRMEGFRTRSIRDKEMDIREHRMMGSSDKNVFRGRIRWGWGQYFMGTHPLYILASGVYRLLERPFIIGGLLIIFGYIKGALTRTKRYDHPGFRRSLHAWQFERLGLGKRLETIPEAREARQELAEQI